MQLSTIDLWAVARAAQGLDWRSLKGITPLIAGMLNNLQQPKDAIDLLRLLGPETSQNVLQIADPSSEPPIPSPTVEPDIIIPELPSESRLSDELIKSAENVGGWVNDFLKWSTKRTPMTPTFWLEAGALYCIGLAVARRLYLHIHEPIYPHFYILWVGRTSVYRKTSGLKCVLSTINKAIPHMLFSEEMTPEAFISSAAGRHPANYEKMPPWEKKMVDESMKHAAQRGVVLDEASSLFASNSKKDYMAGSEEMWLRAFDAAEYYSRETSADGKTIIRDMAMSMLGATTPAAFKRVIDPAAWETGLTARFAMLYMDEKLPHKDTSHDTKYFEPPDVLVRRLIALHQKLPLTPQVALLDGEAPPRRQQIGALIDKDVFPMFRSYAKALQYDLLWGNLDARLHGNYSRLPVYTEKVALALAAIDWADSGAPKEGVRITVPHYARAQQITEKWRASLHRMLAGIAKSKDSEDEDAIYKHLESYPKGETLRELLYRTGVPRKNIVDALEALIESGNVEAIDQQKARGPKTTIYRIIEGQNP